MKKIELGAEGRRGLHRLHGAPAGHGRLGAPGPRWPQVSARTGVLLIAVAATFVAIGFANKTWATPVSYPPAPTCSTTATTSASGSIVTGNGFAPGGPVSLTMGSEHTVVLADRFGRFTASLTTPAGRLVATGRGCAAQSEIAFSAPTVVDPPPPVPESTRTALPKAGTELRVVAALGGVMLFAGLILVLSGRRSRKL